MTQKTLNETVKIEKLIEGGRGLARVDGEVLFVKGGIPGEEVTATTGVAHKGYREVEIQEIISASPHRIEAPCPVYGVCGGCQLQHLQYEEQLRQKQTVLQETLKRVGKIDSSCVLPTIPSPEPYGYRSTIRFVVFRDHNGFALGFHRQGTNEAIRATACLLPAGGIRDVMRQVEDRMAKLERLPVQVESVELRYSYSSQEILLIHRIRAGHESQVSQLFDMYEGIQTVVGQIALLSEGKREGRWVRGQEYITEQLQGITFRIGDRSFMQSNWLLNHQIASTLADWIQPSPGLRIVELFAGIGTLGLPLARAGAFVTEVEANPFALADARLAAKISHVGRSRFRRHHAESFLEHTERGEYDISIVDPPRMGLSPKCRKGLVKLGCAKIVYLSCDAPTLARDLKYICDHGYTITRMQPFDMFAQTAHLETLVELVATKGNG